MKNIILLCNMGMSTSLMVNKMREAAEKEGYECKVNAYALQNSVDVIEEADIILVGPQIDFELKRLRSDYPHKLFEAIATADYGRMDGAKVLQHVKGLLK